MASKGVIEALRWLAKISKAMTKALAVRHAEVGLQIEAPVGHARGLCTQVGALARLAEAPGVLV